MQGAAATAALEGRYAALRATAADLTTDELLDVVEQAQREKDAASARQAVALAHLSAREPHLLEDGTSVEVHHGLGHQRLDGPELAAPRIGCSVHVASNRIMTAIRQLTRTPAVIDAMADGDLDEQRAAAVTEETEFLSDESAAEVVRRVAEHWAGLTTGPLRRFVARTAAQVDPEAVAKEADDERERRGLTRRTGTQGTDHWRGDFRVEHARGAWAAVTERARQLVRDGLAETLQQARADAMMELILEHSDVKVVVHTTRAADDEPGGEGPLGTPSTASTDSSSPTESPARPDDAPATESHAADVPSPATATGQDPAAGGPERAGSSGLVEVGGLGGPGTTFVPRDWLMEASSTALSPTDTGAAGSHRVLACDRSTGALLRGDVPQALASGRTRRSRSRPSEEQSPKYRIPAAMARLVRLRDGCCRFPGCAIPALQCDLDHVRPWPAGPTVPANLTALCRRHHRVKQRAGWTVRILPDATVHWTDPSGHQSTTMPVDHLHFVTASRPTTGQPTTGQPTTSHTSATEAGAAPGGRATVDLPSTFEEELHELLASHPSRPLRARPRVWAFDGTLISGPPPAVDLESGPGPACLPGARLRIVVEHRPPPAPAPSVIPF